MAIKGSEVKTREEKIKYIQQEGMVKDDTDLTDYSDEYLDSIISNWEKSVALGAGGIEALFEDYAIRLGYNQYSPVFPSIVKNMLDLDNYIAKRKSDKKDPMYIGR